MLFQLVSTKNSSKMRLVRPGPVKNRYQLTRSSVRTRYADPATLTGTKTG